MILMNMPKNLVKIFFFIFLLSFIYLMLCPFAQALSCGSESQVIIPQKQEININYKQKDHSPSPIYLFKDSQRETRIDGSTAISLPITSHQEPAVSLIIVAAIRLII